MKVSGSSLEEMNIHVPQGIEAQTELNLLCTPLPNIISAQSSKPNLVIAQDALLGAYKMTQGIQSITMEQFTNIACNLNFEREFSISKRIQDIRRIFKKFGKKSQCYHGKGIISLFLPPTLNYSYKNDNDPLEPIVKISEGVLYEGTLDKTLLGSSFVSLICIINKEYSPSEALFFIDCVQYCSNHWFTLKTFSIHLGDCLVSSESKTLEIKEVINKCFLEADVVQATTNHPAMRESRTNSSLNKARDVGLRLAKEALSINNNFISTVKSGSKGDYFNIAQITGLLGQQNLKGERMKKTLNNGIRSLPQYQYKLSSEEEYESRGFISSSFIKGLNPKEFYFHAMSGREGICDTALGTATSGYMQRRIVKLMEDILVRYDNTVRDATGKLLESAFGGDMFDPVKTVRVNGSSQCCDVGRIIDRLNQE